MQHFVVLCVTYALLFLCRYEMPNATFRFLGKKASTAEGTDLQAV